MENSKRKIINVSLIFHSFLISIVLIAPFYGLIKKSEYKYIIIGILLLLVTYIVNLILMKNVEANKYKRLLEKTSIDGIAKIIKAENTKTRIRNNPLMKFTLMIKGSDRKEYEGFYNKVVNSYESPKYQVGKFLKVKFSPLNTSKFIKVEPVEIKSESTGKDKDKIKLRLEKLEKLYRSKIISEEEYSEKRSEIIDEI